MRYERLIYALLERKLSDNSKDLSKGETYNVIVNTINDIMFSVICR
jgi:hypothetical protein